MDLVSDNRYEKHKMSHTKAENHNKVRLWTIISLAA
jgi:hypothetical protein